MGLESNYETDRIRLNSQDFSATVTTQTTEVNPASETLPIVETYQQELTQAEKNEMQLYKLDYNNPNDVATFRAMTPDDKRNRLGELSDGHKHIHNFDIDTQSEEWNGLSPQQKIDRILEAGVRAQQGYDDAAWEALGKTRQNRLKNKFFESEFSAHVKDWDKKTTEEQLNYMSTITNIYAMSEAEDVSMSFKELLELYKNNPQEFDRIQNAYFSADSNRVKADYLSNVHELVQKLREREADYNASLTARYGTENYTIDQQLEYLQTSDNRTKFEDHKLETLTELKRRTGNNSSLIPNGRNSVLSSSLLTPEQLSSLPRENNGEVDFKKAYPRALSMATDRLVACKTDEEFNELIKDLKPEDFLKILDEIQKRQDLSPEFLKIYENYNQNADAGSTVLLVAACTENAANTSEPIQRINASSISTNKHTIQDAGGDTECVNEYAHAIGQFYTKENVATAHGNAALDSDKELVANLNEGTSEREDRHEVFGYLNDFYANSTDIEDEMKEYYAQSSIEVLKSPEDRQIQSDSLGRYNNDSFNRGVQQGYENIANNERNNSSVNGNNVSNGNEVTKICQNPVNTSNPEAAQIQQNLRRLDLTKSEDVEKFLEIVDQHGLAISNYLAGCSAKDREDFISAYCLKANPKQIMKFLQANPSMYRDILNESGSKLAPYKEQIFVMLLPNNDLNDLAKVLDIDLEKFAKANGQYAPDIALRTKNKDLARRLVTNPVEFNFNLGDPKAPQLRLLASTGNFPEITNIGKHFEWRKA